MEKNEAECKRKRKLIRSYVKVEVEDPDFNCSESKESRLLDLEWYNATDKDHQLFQRRSTAQANYAKLRTYFICYNLSIY